MDPIKVLVYGWKLVDYPEKLGPEGQFYSPIIWESVNYVKKGKLSIAEGAEDLKISPSELEEMIKGK